MEIINKICPFSHGQCAECSFYIGRHHYTDFYRRYHCHYHPAEKPNFDSIFMRLASNSSNAIRNAEDHLPDIKLKIIDFVTEEETVHDIEEAVKWDWRKSDEQRFINGSIHITSWGQLLEYCRRRAEKGEKEIVIYKGPDQLLVSGG